jgi:integrase
MAFNINLTKRERTRKLKSGERVTHTRFVLNYKEPRTGQRKQLFFDKKANAQAKRNELLASVETGSYSEAKTHISVAAASRRGSIIGAARLRRTPSGALKTAFGSS